MNSRRFAILAIVLMVICMAGVAQAWQGRMAGMGDPVGLVKDESDFLIHPAEIADGKGANFYGNFNFDYHNVHRLDYTMEYFNSATGALLATYPFQTRGSGRQTDTLLGAAIPLGQGRLGLFLQYAYKHDTFNGTEVSTGVNNTYSFEKELQSLNMRAIYGMPIGSWKLGGEVQLAYRNREDETSIKIGTETIVNSIIGAHGSFFNTFPLMYPNDSNWWEALFKISAEGQLGPGTLTFTPRGGFVFGGNSDLHFYSTIGTSPFEDIVFDGNVSGWNVGGDLWWRMPMSGGVSLPVLFRVDYDRKKWDGAGSNILGNVPYTYESKERNLQIETGAGVDKEYSKGSRLAAGLYYNYIQSDNSFMYALTEPGYAQRTDHVKYPNSTEHRLVLKLAGEKEISSAFTARMGIKGFYGWVKEKYNYEESYLSSASNTEQISPDGNHYGVLIALGGTMKLPGVVLEPYITTGYQKLDISGTNGSRTGGLSLNMDKKREEGSIGAGLSVKF
jgi:hypothetical protein